MKEDFAKFMGQTCVKLATGLAIVIGFIILESIALHKKEILTAENLVSVISETLQSLSNVGSSIGLTGVASVLIAFGVIYFISLALKSRRWPISSQRMSAAIVEEMSSSLTTAGSVLWTIAVFELVLKCFGDQSRSIMIESSIGLVLFCIGWLVFRSRSKG